MGVFQIAGGELFGVVRLRISRSTLEQQLKRRYDQEVDLSS